MGDLAKGFTLPRYCQSFIIAMRWDRCAFTCWRQWQYFLAKNTTCSFPQLKLNSTTTMRSWYSVNAYFPQQPILQSVPFFFILHYHCILITLTYMYIVRWLFNEVTEVFLYCFSQEILELTLAEYIAVFPRDHFLYPLITVSIYLISFSCTL